MSNTLETISDAASAETIPFFPPGYRASGLLLHITSLPSPYGIGDLGPAAFTWIDRLHDCGQTWWQALPLGPTGYGNSPYQCLSSFVGNGLLISPELLIEDGLLKEGDCKGQFSSTTIDYDVVIPFKHRLLEVAWASFHAGMRKDLRPGYEEFCHSRANWLEDYALFQALNAKYRGAPYLEWPEELGQRIPSALAQARRHLADEVDRIRLAQFLLFRQAKRLKEYARTKGVLLIGDLPFFVSPNSSDVWANPELFLLNEHRQPRFVAGVPPDYFSAQGQLWGNPVYNWEALARTGYAWCIDRLRALPGALYEFALNAILCCLEGSWMISRLLAHVDAIRIDHFRAFAAAWHVPAGAPTAEAGEWRPGPGADFFRAVRSALGALPFVAEDLGVITPDVSAMRDEFRISGTRVLQFAFDGNPNNVHLPENYSTNTVVYTGTHDNPTTREWFGELPDAEQRRIWAYLRRPEGEIPDAAPELIRLAWSSPAALAIAPLQDVLNLGKEGRMNIPGTAEGNWRWRLTPHILSANTFRSLEGVTETSKRSGMTQRALSSKGKLEPWILSAPSNLG